MWPSSPAGARGPWLALTHRRLVMLSHVYLALLPAAHLGDGANLRDGTDLGDGANLEDGASHGDGANLGDGASLGDGANHGDWCNSSHSQSHTLSHSLIVYRMESEKDARMFHKVNDLHD